MACAKPFIVFMMLIGLVCGVVAVDLMNNGCGQLRSQEFGVVDLVPKVFDLRGLFSSRRSYICVLPELSGKKSCSDYKHAGTGEVRLVDPDGAGPFTVYCDAEGWAVIQRRTSLDLDFNRTWEEYKSGFGDPSGDHWLGLRKVNRLKRLTNNTFDCRFEAETVDGNRILLNSSCVFKEDFRAAFWQRRGDKDSVDGFLYPRSGDFQAYDLNYSAEGATVPPVNCPLRCGGGIWDKCSAHINGRLTAPSPAEDGGSVCAPPITVVKTLMKMWDRQ